MSIVKISAAFETRLALLSPALATAYENAAYTPVTNTPYQRIKLLPAQPENPTLGDGYYREVGICEIVLFYPINTGRGLAQAKADAIKNHFKRGTAMIEQGITVKVSRTPTVSQGIADGDRYAIPISIFYYCELIVA